MSILAEECEKEIRPKFGFPQNLPTDQPYERATLDPSWRFLCLTKRLPVK